MTSPELLERIQAIVTARGGKWPSGINDTVLAMLVTHRRQKARTVREDLRALFQARGGEFAASHQDLADLLSVSRETVSRSIKQAGIVRTDRRGPGYSRSQWIYALHTVVALVLLSSAGRAQCVDPPAVPCWTSGLVAHVRFCPAAGADATTLYRVVVRDANGVETRTPALGLPETFFDVPAAYPYTVTAEALAPDGTVVSGVPSDPVYTEGAFGDMDGNGVINNHDFERWVPAYKLGCTPPS